jgi:hypothetical protein
MYLVYSTTHGFRFMSQIRCCPHNLDIAAFEAQWVIYACRSRLAVPYLLITVSWVLSPSKKEAGVFPFTSNAAYLFRSLARVKWRLPSVWSRTTKIDFQAAANTKIISYSLNWPKGYVLLDCIRIHDEIFSHCTWVCIICDTRQIREPLLCVGLSPKS